MASFKVTCNQCGQEQTFSDADPDYNDKDVKYLRNDWYFQTANKKIIIEANPFSDPPEITIECKNPDCKSEI